MMTITQHEATESSSPSSGANVDATITCTDLVRIYSSEGVEVQALQGLNLRVANGELVAIIGASGSGKSTLLGILSGLDTPTAGSAVVAGRRLGSLSKREKTDYLRFGVGFVWQQTGRNLLPYLDTAENVAVPMLLAGASPSARQKRVAELLDLLEIAHVAHRRPADMSGGELQRAAIAIALANSPRVLLADEPTGELDEATSVDVLESMRSVNRELGITTLIVTHDATVSEHVGRTVQIRDGRTSTEVLRTSASGSFTDGHVAAETFTVIDSLGRLQLPAEYVNDLALHDRVRLALESDHVGVFPGAAPPPNARPADAGPADPDADTDANAGGATVIDVEAGTADHE
jgi:putative ABC transport system ATP-binding protein